jgi:cytochrome c oxidase subunit 1
MMVWAIVGDRRAQLHRVGAPHVCQRHAPLFGFFFATSTLIIAIPTAIKVYNWVSPVEGRHPLDRSDAVRAGFIVTFVNGGLTGLFLGNVVSMCRCPTPCSWSRISTW